MTYVIIPSCTSGGTLAEAKKKAQKESKQYGGAARVECCETGKTVAVYHNGVQTQAADGVYFTLAR